MLKRGQRVIALKDIKDKITAGLIYSVIGDEHNEIVKVRDNDQNHFFINRTECYATNPAVKDSMAPIESAENTRERFVKAHGEVCDSLKEITRQKNSDYTGNTDDPFANFRQVETFNICTTEQGFLTRMTDKMSRIASLIGQKKAPEVKDESIEDTLKDLANYSILLMLYVQQEKNN